MTFLISAMVGLLTGIISAFGIGGGTLLIVYMTAIAGLQRADAAGINLLYFLPTSASALWGHIRHGLISMDIVLPAAIAGMSASAAGALLASVIDTEIIKKIFGLFLIYVGLRELFSKKRNGE